jgi:RNA polymerase sigma factor (sigma-70 family)
MPELNDHELLAEFARSESETAFAELVARHVNLVYSAALRFSGTPHCAEEITQAVFIILARKAKNISGKIILSGWLYQTARLTAANFMKGEIRRQQREQEAYMQSTLNETDAAAWQQIAPLLDEAMGHLGETDRTAVVLRFFENKTAAEVAAALKLTEAAAHKRVNRALEKLRKIFSQRGVTLSATIIAGVVAANSVQAAPASLAATVTAAASGASISATLTTLVKGTMKTMTWLKLKFAIGVGVTALLAGGVATVAVSQIGGGDKLPAQEIFAKAQAAYAALTSYSDEGKSVATLNGTTITHTFSIRLARPNLYRIEWEQSSESVGFKSTTEKQVVWSEGKGDFLETFGHAQKQSNKENALSSATGISGGAAATIPGTFFKLNWGNQLGGSVAGEKRLADEKVGAVDCYVFASDSKGRTKTIWIGKQDFLIHQVRTVTSAAAMKAVMAEAAKRNPELAARMPKIEYTGNTSTETHENILVNPKLSSADFAR